MKFLDQMALGVAVGLAAIGLFTTFNTVPLWGCVLVGFIVMYLVMKAGGDMR